MRMRSLARAACLAWILCAAGASNCRAEPADRIRLYETPAGENPAAFWDAPVDEIGKWPLWKIGNEPPISVRTAIALAARDLDRGGRFQLESVQILHPAATDPRLNLRRVFFFVVQYQRIDAATNTVRRKVVVVNMAGQIVPMQAK